MWLDAGYHCFVRTRGIGRTLLPTNIGWEYTKVCRRRFFLESVLCPGVPLMENPAYAIDNVGFEDGGLQCAADNAHLQGR
jgi:hypothetical protein